MSANLLSLNSPEFPARAFRNPLAWARGLGAALWRRADRDFPEILDLDDRMLRDIGLTRLDVMEMNSGDRRR